MDQTVWHIALREDWEAAEPSGVYTVSTRGRSVAEVGFLHASFDVDQVRRVAAGFYADAVPLAILEISVPALGAAGIEVRSEPADAADSGSERFPHVYGSVPVAAVLRVVPAWVPDGELVAPRLVDRAHLYRLVRTIQDAPDRDDLVEELDKIDVHAMDLIFWPADAFGPGHEPTAEEIVAKILE